MAATVQIWEMTAAGTGVDKTSGTVRFKSANETSVDTNNRLQIPSGADAYSYTKQLQFRLVTAPSVDIQNLRFYTDGGNGFGTGVSVGYKVIANFTTNINTALAGTTDLFTATSVATVSLGTGPYTWAGQGSTSSNIGSLVQLQMVVANTATSGALSAETITFAYDET